MSRLPLPLMFALYVLIGTTASAQEVTFHRDIAPLLTKYCVGCHNAEEAEGGLAMHSFEKLREGGDEGQVLDWEEPTNSPLWKRITGELEPRMPPEGEPAPNADELGLLERWFKAEMPKGQPQGMVPRFPELQAAPEEMPSHWDCLHGRPGRCARQPGQS